MYVNPFWFGFLMAIVVMIVLSIVLSIIKSNQKEEWEEYEPTNEELKETLEAVTGKKFRIVKKNGYLVGEEIKDKDYDEEENKQDN